METTRAYVSQLRKQLVNIIVSPASFRDQYEDCVLPEAFLPGKFPARQPISHELNHYDEHKHSLNTVMIQWKSFS
jgi:hypothetical protein